MLLPLQRILLARRARWLCRKKMAAIDKIWSSVGHGNGPMRDYLPACLPRDCQTPVEHGIPAPDQSGLHEPLHAHVRDTCNGWEWREPQEHRREEKQAAEAVLFEQGMHILRSLQEECD